MKIDPDTVSRIAELAQLSIDENAVPEYLSSMQNILDLALSLEDLDTSDVEPLKNPLEQYQILREDKVTESDNRARYQAVAPAVDDGLYLVPRVIE